MLKRIIRFFMPRCYSCKEGKLKQDDIHITKNYVELNVYSCDKCGKKYI